MADTSMAMKKVVWAQLLPEILTNFFCQTKNQSRPRVTNKRTMNDRETTLDKVKEEMGVLIRLEEVP